MIAIVEKKFSNYIGNTNLNSDDHISIHKNIKVLSQYKIKKYLLLSFIKNWLKEYKIELKKILNPILSL
jgi:hypothetical protein